MDTCCLLFDSSKTVETPQHETSGGLRGRGEGGSWSLFLKIKFTTKGYMLVIQHGNGAPNLH